MNISDVLLLTSESSSSTSSMAKHNFGAFDYVVFGSFLLASAAIGVIFGIRSRKSTNNKDYLTGNRNLATFPVVMSLAASFMSTNTILGVPAEIYTLGTQFVIHIIPFTVAVFLSAYVFMPVFYELNMTSVNEYLFLRFGSHRVRLVGSFAFIFCTLPYMGVVLYGPSLALSSVTSLPVEHSVVVVGILCTFYTSIGGIKAVIWTDVLQCILMILGLVLVVIYGFAEATVNPFTEAYNHGRIKVFDFDLNPYRNDIFFAVFLGTLVSWCGCYCISQTEVQRFCSTKSSDHARKTLLWNIPPVIGISLLAIVSGIILFARYHTCDPVSMGIIKRYDQLMPYFVMDTMSWMPGVPGFFTACVFSGSLSTLSSGFNSLAAVTWDDFLKDRFAKQSKWTPHITKLIAASYGIVSLGLAFFVGQLGTVLQASMALSGSTRGPLLAIFVLGLFFPFANETGALTGVVSGISLSLVMAIGTIIHPRPKAHLPLSTDSCTIEQYYLYGHHPVRPHIMPWEVEPEGIDRLLHLSYYYVSVVGFVTTMTIGIVVSVIFRYRHQKPIDSRLMSKWRLPDEIPFPWKSKYQVNERQMAAGIPGSF